MTTHAASRDLYDVGYRRVILALGAAWGFVPAASFAMNFFDGVSPTLGTYAVAAAMTVSLGALYELDSRRLAAHGEGVPLAWAYALVAPISIVFVVSFGHVLAAVPGGASLMLLAGPPASALLYVWQRGRVGSVDNTRE